MVPENAIALETERGSAEEDVAAGLPVGDEGGFELAGLVVGVGGRRCR